MCLDQHTTSGKFGAFQCTSILRRVHRPRSCTTSGKLGAIQEQIHFTSSSSTSKLYHQRQIRSISSAHQLYVELIDLKAAPPAANRSIPSAHPLYVEFIDLEAVLPVANTEHPNAQPLYVEFIDLKADVMQSRCRCASCWVYA